MSRDISKLCPIFRKDKVRIVDLPLSGSELLAGTFSMVVPYIETEGGTSEVTTTITGLDAGDVALVQPQRSMSPWALISAVKVTANTVTVEFMNSCGSACAVGAQDFVWRRINTY